MNTRRFLFTLFMFIIIAFAGNSETPKKEVYLITCSPGNETYSIYGHSALRIVDNTGRFDKAYNWGVFEFNTPNFNLKFARGRLDYKLGVYSYKTFLEEYYNEKRAVYIQKINLDSIDIVEIENLLKENIKEENLYYRYDFLKDNCSTRVRDILEEALGDKLLFPAETGDDISSFRNRLGEYQQKMPWLDAGVDILIGSPGDSACGYYESMFLPDYLMWNLARARILSEKGEMNLLEPAETVFTFETEESDMLIDTRPVLLLSALVMVLVIISLGFRKRKVQNGIDLFLFVPLALLASLMIFANFFSDHEAMNRNFNIIWLNPLLFLVPLLIFGRKRQSIFWLVIIILELVFIVIVLIGLQQINIGFIPLIIAIIIRAGYRYRSKLFRTRI